MSATWMTKYGRRGVSHNPPTLDEALFAAEGLTDVAGQQIELAAELMHVPLAQVQAEAKRILKSRNGRVRIVQPRQARGTVVVERKAAPRVLLRRAG